MEQIELGVLKGEEKPEEYKPQTQYKPVKPPVIGTLTRPDDSSKLVRCIQDTPEEVEGLIKKLILKLRRQVNTKEVVEVYISMDRVEINHYLQKAKRIEKKRFDNFDVEELRQRFLSAARRAGANFVKEIKSGDFVFIYYYDIRDEDKIYSIKLN